MVYLRPGNWPTADASAYERFVDLWAAIVVDRVVRGDRVHLFVTDPADMKAVADVRGKLDARTRDKCSINEHRTPDALLTFFRQMDIVVSSRLHGVLLAINTGRPVLAISHERKVRAVMGDVGLTAYCTDLPTVSAEQVSAMLRELTKNLGSCERKLAEYVSWARAAIRQQDEMLPHLMRRR
jgi:polysaccharide pyruvyl transferase WcaK-like protein